MTTAPLHALGFSDLATDSQAVFRAILEAMSKPGRRIVNPVDCRPPSSLTPATAAIALCLIDHDVMVWFDEAAAPAAGFVQFHTNAKRCDDPRDAAFAVIGRPETMPHINVFNAGSTHYPEQSTTLIIQTATLEGGPPVHLAGPGIEHRETIAPATLPSWFWDSWTVNKKQFPLGVDVLMTDTRHFVGLPRTSRRCDP